MSIVQGVFEAKVFQIIFNHKLQYGSRSIHLEQSNHQK